MYVWHRQTLLGPASCTLELLHVFLLVVSGVRLGPAEKECPTAALGVCIARMPLQSSVPTTPERRNQLQYWHARLGWIACSPAAKMSASSFRVGSMAWDYSTDLRKQSMYNTFKSELDGAAVFSPGANTL